mmetsp:Transcript_78615/g.163397  ORF Transcript_78615/g.163397 Transcript_78615/m.163397 type:complete len:566 (-) Transcript_78615:578-2275(-)
MLPTWALLGRSAVVDRSGDTHKPWTGLLSICSASALGLLLLQYWPVWQPRWKKLPPGNSGWPFLIGHTLNLLGDLGAWLQSMHERYGPAFRCCICGMPAVCVDCDTYDRCLAKLDGSAQFVPLWPSGFQALLGDNALQFLLAGSGQRGARHRRLKRKVGDALTVNELRKFLPRIEEIMDREFKDMVAETARDGQTSLMPHCMRIVKTVILELVLGPDGIRAEEYQQDTSKILLDGMIAAPIDLGRCTAYGRAMTVRRNYHRDVERQRAAAVKAALQGALESEKPDGWQTILTRLAKDCEHGAGLSIEEMQDMLISLLFGGSLTTAETMQWLTCEVYRHTDWFERLTKEQRNLRDQADASPAGLKSIWAAPEGKRSPCPESLLACYETLRLHCPIDVLLRSVEEPVDLGGDLGTIPAGWWVAVHLTERGKKLGPEFNPDRWIDRAAASEVHAFGLGPHFCVGRHLALWELQIFLHTWLTRYNIEILSDEIYHQTGLKRFKGGMPVKVTAQTPEDLCTGEEERSESSRLSETPEAATLLKQGSGLSITTTLPSVNFGSEISCSSSDN